jgi:type II secretory pathway pseudopilin PulG
VRRLAHVRRSTPPPSSRAGAAGETLIEVLVTVLLLGFGFAIIFGSLFSASKINDLNKRRTIASQGVQAWAEGLQQPATRLQVGSSAYTYQNCALPESYGQIGLPPNAIPAAWRSYAPNQAPVAIEYFNGTFNGFGEPNFQPSQSACEGSGDKGLQRITLRIVSPPGSGPAVQETLVIIKRNAACPTESPTFENPDLGPC